MDKKLIHALYPKSIQLSESASPLLFSFFSFSLDDDAFYVVDDDALQNWDDDALQYWDDDDDGFYSSEQLPLIM